MADTVIRVENLGKKYQLGLSTQAGPRYETLRESLSQGVQRLFRPNGRKIPRVEDFWALQDISFDVGRGDVVGLIGRNGAGKSTLLKILSRITEPTEGMIHIKGRVASLLEVGTGFHPELTGRENIFLNGAILGMSKQEIKSKFEEIVAFAEIEQFLDVPVKRYSSGMYVRLAFAVAAHLEPEILVVDEVLAVGDAEFQRKCLGKMREVSRGGRTVIFVSHNMHAITGLCQRAIWLEKGRVKSIGDAPVEVAKYTAGMLSSSASVQIDQPEGDSPIRISRVRLTTGAGKDEITFDQFDSVTIKLDVVQTKPNPALRFVARIRPLNGDVVALETTDWDAGLPLSNGMIGNYVVECRLPGNMLNPAAYLLSVGIDEPGGPVYVLLDSFLGFSIIRKTPESGHFEDRNSIISPCQDWTIGS